MSTLRFVQTPAVALYTGLSTSATSMRITPYPVDLDGTKLTIADFGDSPTATIDPKVSGFEEIVSFTGITDNGDGTATLTGLTRDLLSKYPYTTPGTGKLHGSSAVVVFSDNPQVYNRLAAKENDETITGFWSTPTPTLAAHIANKGYVDSVVAAGAADADSATKGVTKLSVTAQKTLGTATMTIATPAVVSFTAHGLIAGDKVKFTTTGALPTGVVAGTTYYVIAAGLTANAFEIASTLGGTAINTTGTQSGVHTLYRMTPFAVADNDPRVFPNAGGADTGTANTYAMTLATAPTAYVAYQIYAFKATNTNTGASTFNVNGLGAVAIKKDGTTALAGGEIVAGQISVVMHDGTNFQLVSRVNTPALNVQTFTATGAGTWTKPNNARYTRVQIWGGGASGTSSSATLNQTAGGGGGAYNEQWFASSSLGTTETVTVGAGGAAVSGNTQGIAGGNTTFGSWLTAWGGGAPDGPANAFRLGGVGGGIDASGGVSSGVPLAGGGAGGDGIHWGGGAGGGCTNGGNGTSGGRSVWGGGGGGSSNNSVDGAGGISVFGGNGGVGSHSGNATDGAQPGGGGGAYHLNGGGGFSGKGGDGKAIISTICA